MSFDTLEQLLESRDQFFTCVPAGNDRKDKCLKAPISHEVTNALTSDEIKQLEDVIGYHDQLFELFRSYGSVRLFCDANSGDSAYYIAHPDEWEELYQDFRIWLEELDGSEYEELVPSWIGDAVVLGEIPSSGNYFLFLTKGIGKGKVFEFEHDGFQFIEVSKDVVTFVDRIATVTEELIENLQSHTRFSDGETKIQWIPIRYEGIDKNGLKVVCGEG